MIRTLSNTETTRRERMENGRRDADNARMEKDEGSDDYMEVARGYYLYLGHEGCYVTRKRTEIPPFCSRRIRLDKAMRFYDDPYPFDGDTAGRWKWFESFMNNYEVGRKENGGDDRKHLGSLFIHTHLSERVEGTWRNG
jgi:hypothetical protein